MAMRKNGWLILVALLAAAGVASAQVNMEFKGADVRDVLHVLGQMGGYNIVLDHGVQGEVTLQLKDIPVDDAIELVVKVSGYSAEWVATNTLVVASADQIKTRFASTTTQLFDVRHVSPGALVPALQTLLEAASVVADPLGHSIIVQGTADELAFAADFISKRDVPAPVLIDVTEASVTDIFRTLAKAGGYTLIADRAVQGELTFYYNGTDVLEAIQLVSRLSGVTYSVEGKQLIVRASHNSPVQTGASTFDTASQPRDEVRIFRLNYVKPSHVRSVVAAIVGDTKVTSDDANDTLIVTASPGELTAVAGLLVAYDVPQLRVRGVVAQDDSRIVILEVNDETHVLAEGSRIAGYTVQSVTFDEIVLVAADGQRRTLSHWKGAK